MDKKDDNQLSKNILEAVKQIKSGTSMPGGDKSSEEIQYSTTDLILGIAAVGMFGSKFKSTKHTNINTVLGQKSFLENISTNFNNFTKNILTNSKKSIRVSIVNNPIVKLSHESMVGLTPASIDALKSTIEPNIKTKNSKDVGKIVLSIENSSNFNELVDSLKKLQDILNDNVKIGSNIKFLGDIITSINNFPKIESLNIDNNVSDKLSTLIKSLYEIDTTKLSELKTENLSKLDKYITYINTIVTIAEKLKDTNLDKEKINDFVESINNILDITNEKDVDKLNNFNINRFISSVQNITQITPDNISNIKDNIKNLKDLFDADSGSFRKLFEAINNLLYKDDKPIFDKTITDITGIGIILDTITNIISYDKKINLKTLNLLLSITEKDKGQIPKLFDQLKEIVSKNKDLVIGPIRILNDYFNAIASLGEIGFAGRLRIKNNLDFFRTFINKNLPNLINDINERFANVTEIKNIPGLYGLVELFNLISQIGEISINNKRKLKFNLMFIKYFIFDDIIKLIKSFNEEIDKEIDNIKLDSINKVFESLMSIANLEKDKLVNSQYVIKKLHGIVYRDEKNSLRLLLKEIERDQQIIKNSNEHILNLQTSIDTIFNFIDSIELDSTSLAKASKDLALLRRIELPLILSIIKFISEKINPNAGDEEKIKNINAFYLSQLKALNIKLFELNVDKEKTQEVFDNLHYGINSFLLVMQDTKKLAGYYETVDHDIFVKVNEFLKSIKPDAKISDKTYVLIHNLAQAVTNLSILLDTTSKLKIPETEFTFNLQNFLTNFKEAFNDVESLEILVKKITISEDVAKDIEKTKSILNSILEINNTIKTLVEFSSIIKPFQTLLENEVKIINNFITGFEAIDQEKIEAAQNTIKELTKLMILSSIVLIVGAESLVYIDIKNLLTFGAILSGFTILMSSICVLISKNFGEKELKGFEDAVNGLMKIIIISSATLLFSSIVMKIINIENLLLFTGALTLFVLSITGALWIISKTNFKDSFNVIMDFSKLVAISGATLIFGSLIAQNVVIADLIAFGFSLLVFIYALSKPLKKFTEIAPKMFEGAEDLGTLVVLCGLSLALGSLITKYVDFVDLISFTANLAIFIAALSIPLFMIAYGGGKILMDGASELGKIVLMSTAALLIGGLFMKIDGLWAESISFAKILGQFILGISLAIGLGAWLTHGNGLEITQELTKLIMISAGILLIAGGLFLWEPELKDAVISFAWILGSFISAIIIAVGIVGRLNKNTIQSMWQLSLIIAVSAGVLLFAAYIMKDNENITGKLFGFTAAMLLLIGGIVLIAKLASKEFTKLLLGLTAVGIISLIVFGLSYVFKYMVDNILKYDGVIGDLWALTMSMLGIIAVILLASAALGAIIVGTGGVAGGFIVVGMLAIGLAGAFVWGMAWLFSQILEIDKSTGNKLSAANGSAGINTLVDNLFDVTEHILLKLYKLQTSDNKLTKEIKNIPLVGGLIGTIIDGLTIFPNLRIAKAGVAAMAEICQNIALLNIYMGLVGENPKKKIDDAGDLIEKLLGIYNREDIVKQVKEIKKNEELLNGMVQMSQVLSDVIYKISLGIKNYAELRVEEIGPDGKPTGKFRQFTDNDFESAARNISSIITCVGGSIMGLLGIGPYAQMMTPGQQEIAKEMLETKNTGFAGLWGTKTKFALILEGAMTIGDIISKIAEGAMKWSKLPNTWKPNDAATNIANIITLVGGAIMSLVNSGSTHAEETTKISSKNIEFKKIVVNEMLQTVNSGFLGLGSKKTKFQMILEASEKIGDIITNIAKGAIKWNNLPPKFDAKKASTNIQTIITTIGGAIIKLYNGEGLDNITKKTANEMFETNWWLNRKNKFTQVIESVNKLGIMISGIMESVQSYANLKIPTKFDDKGKPTNWRRMTDVDFYMAQFNIGKIIATLGEALMKVGNSDVFKRAYYGQNVKNISEAIINISKVINPIAEAIWMYATGKFPKLAYKGGKLTTIGWYDAVTEGDGVEKVADKAAKNIGIIITSLSIKIAELLKDEKVKLMYKDADEIKTLSSSLITISVAVNKTLSTLKPVISHGLTKNKIENNISEPFKEFITGIYPNSLAELHILIANGTIYDYIKTVKSISGQILKIFNDLNKIINLSKEINPNIALMNSVYIDYIKLYNTISTFASTVYKTEIGEVMKQYNDDLKEVINLVNQVDENKQNQFNILKEGINGLATVIAGIKSNKNFTDHVNNVKKYVESTNKLNLEKIKSLTNLVNAITNFGKSFGSIDDFTNKVVEKLTDALSNLATKLDEAKGTIESADNLHSKREKLIKKSIENITELMKNELTVNIKGESSENKYTSPGLNPTNQTNPDKKESTKQLFDNPALTPTWSPTNTNTQEVTNQNESKSTHPYIDAPQVTKQIQPTKIEFDTTPIVYELKNMLMPVFENVNE